MVERSLPNITTIAPGSHFTEELALGILEKYSEQPMTLADTLILLPTRRACRSLRDAFLHVSKGESFILPKIRSIADIDEEEISIQEVLLSNEAITKAVDIPPAIPEIRRQLLLSQLILKMHRQRQGNRVGKMNISQAIALAADLASLLDQLQTQRLSFSALNKVVPEKLAAHWQETFIFLSILTEHWPALLAAEGSIDPADRRNRLLELQALIWTQCPPKTPIIAAGSTGSIPATADLIKVIASLPRGTVILPGLDRDLDESSWSAVGETHPQFGMRNLLSHIGVSREDVGLWREALSRSPIPEHTDIMSAAMQPAEMTHKWRDFEDKNTQAMSGITRIDCLGRGEEARVVALIMRKALEEPAGTAALVTPDRDLARRVASEIRRWNLEIDDSAGISLGETVPGVFFRLVAQMAVENLSPIPLLSALKHPLAAGGIQRDKFRRAVRVLELSILHGPRPTSGISGLTAALNKAGGNEDSIYLIRLLSDILSPFLKILQKKKVFISDLLNNHVDAFEALASEEFNNGETKVWSGESGIALADFVADFHEATEGIGAISGSEYPALVSRLLRKRVVRPYWGSHPRLNIWGLREARLQKSDVMILAGLNEGMWPPEPVTDPWLSRPMREAIGLPSPERKIGLTAHDFIQAISGKKVYITRSEKVNGIPTVPSRWLLRLETLQRKLNIPQSHEQSWIAWQAELDSPELVLPPILPPEPRPPPIARPRHFSVSDIETWLRDPYSLYARKILKLHPLDPVDSDPGLAARGILVHSVLHKFVSDYDGFFQESAKASIIEVAQKILPSTITQPAINIFWWPRFERIASWFVDTMRGLVENERISIVGVEVPGEMIFHGASQPIILVARADRIDRLSNGALHIIDYKTGLVPTQSEISLGLSPQLILEALIAKCGTFEGIETAPVDSLAYWRLTGGAVPGEIQRFVGDVEEEIKQAQWGLSSLITAFEKPQTPYLSRPRPRYALRYGSYDHLARVLEWTTDDPEDLT